MVNQSKSDRERQKLIADKCQSLIEALLKDDDNKYCVDCDAKGPRWASWNLGIFLCIRCAGIHRNLGVHISRVKSVNLDAWTPEHVAYVQRMGNSRARAVYEANLPDDFRRPQTDTALESFIRAKYEHKRYMAQDYVDPGPPGPAFSVEDELRRIKEQKRGKLSGSVSSSFGSTNAPKLNQPPVQQLQHPTQQHQQQQQQLPSQLLFSFDAPVQPALSGQILTSPELTQQTSSLGAAGLISVPPSQAPSQAKPGSSLADLIDLM